MVKPKALLGGSGVAISGVISPLRWVLSIVTLLITLVITTHEPPSFRRRSSPTLPMPLRCSNAVRGTKGRGAAGRTSFVGLGFRV